MKLQLESEWTIGPPVGSGGFGTVREAESRAHPNCVAKFIPKDRGAERELLFEDLTGLPNIVPIIDKGESEDSWVIVMPRAKKSLREEIPTEGLTVRDAAAVLADVATALDGIRGRVVHRDLKPENILFWDGRWCLADFGISRYAEATTAADTRKYALTPAYAAPERWRLERATSASDVYSFGVIAYELLTGRCPFLGSQEDLREAHMFAEPPPLTGLDPAVASFVTDCLYKAPGARLAANQLMARLNLLGRKSTPAAERLKAANLRQNVLASEADRAASAAEAHRERNADLRTVAESSFARFSSELFEAVLTAAPASKEIRGSGRAIQLGEAVLHVADVSTSVGLDENWGWKRPAFDLISYSSISVKIPVKNDYDGRAHSLWFCDAKEEGRFEWYETAFMCTVLSGSRGITDPFSLPPGEGSAKALWNGMAEFQLAWPFDPLNSETISSFVDRWMGWFVDGVDGKLTHPSRMPERSASGSFRA